MSGQVTAPDRHEIRVFFSPNTQYSYMHEDALRELQRGTKETCQVNAPNTFLVQNVRQGIYISKDPDGPFYNTRRKLEHITLKLGLQEGIYLDQVFIVQSPMRVGYHGIHGQHVNKWIVIGMDDMIENGIQIHAKEGEPPKIVKKGIPQRQQKIVTPKEMIPTMYRDGNRPFAQVQNIQTKSKIETIEKIEEIQPMEMDEEFKTCDQNIDESKSPKFAIGALFNKRGLKMSRRHDMVQIYPGKWQFPGGKRERGETTIQAIYREVKEETSYDLTGPEHILYDNQFEVTGSNDPDNPNGCDVFVERIPEQHKKFTHEKDKNGPWKTILYDEFELITERQLCTPTLNKYGKYIVKQCKEMINKG
jgi:8-oxo-dGTP pyrophosphatase MutT (NUDIX family)